MIQVQNYQLPREQSDRIAFPKHYRYDFSQSQGRFNSITMVFCPILLSCCKLVKYVSSQQISIDA